MAYEALIAAFPGQVFLPGTTQYNDTLKSYYTAFESDLSPALVVRPKTVEDVSTVIKIAQQEGLQLAIKGGGCMPWAGAANIDDGITIDMQDLVGVKLSPDHRKVSISAGERWGNVFEALQKENLATVGGRVPRIGVIGFILGGGISYFSGRYGFACDAVHSFEVVLSSGEVVIASATSLPDLFATLKGGSNNFGIVTKVEMPAFPQGQMWGGMTFYPDGALPELFNALIDFLGHPDPDENANILVAYGWAKVYNTKMACASLYHVNPNEADESPPSLKAFISVEPKLMGSTRSDSVLGFAEEQEKQSHDGGRVLYFTTAFKPGLSMLLKVKDLIDAAVESIKAVESLQMFPCVMQPITTRFLESSARGGQNAMGLSPEDGPLVLLECNPLWIDAKDDELVKSVTLEMIGKIEQLAKTEGKEVRWRYLGYSYATQTPIESYGEESVKNMREVSRKYDPSGFFQKNVPGGFKLGLA